MAHHFKKDLKRSQDPDDRVQKGSPPKWTRKAALGNSPGDCCNRRGFPAGKRVHGPPLQEDRYGGLAQLGERLPCKQEVSGSIPLISTKILKRLTEVPGNRCFIEFLWELKDVP